MRWMPMVSLLLIVPGCADPVVPDELKAVLDDPAFSEVGNVVHEGNLDGLPGCWGVFRTEDMETNAIFVEFGVTGQWRDIAYYSYGPLAGVTVEEGTYTVTDQQTVSVVIDRIWHSDPETGELIPEDYLEYPITRSYNVSLQGDQMNFSVPGVSAEQANAGVLRFSECP